MKEIKKYVGTEILVIPNIEDEVLYDGTDIMHFARHILTSKCLTHVRSCPAYGVPLGRDKCTCLYWDIVDILDKMAEWRK